MGSNNVLRMTDPANLTFERLILGLNLLESVLTQSINERGLVENTLLSRKMGARFFAPNLFPGSSSELCGLVEKLV
jgi:hypothetical protein